MPEPSTEQAAPQKLWIAKLEVEAESLLPEGAPPFTYIDPQAAFTVRLLNRAVRPLAEKPLLEMQLEFRAADLKDADKQARPLARQFLYWLSFATHSAFRITQIERLIDWTPGLTVRDQYWYTIDRTDTPQRLIIPDIASTLQLLRTKETPPEVGRAIRWFANGVAANLIDDQFQCFFFAIEILAEFHKSPDRVPDPCPRCRGDLFCPTCGEVPTHRPYAKQAIEQLVKVVVDPGGDRAFQMLDAARNHLMHGRQVDEIDVGLPFEEVIDQAGRIAWGCIMRSIQLPEGTHKLALLQANTFVRRTLTMKTHMQMGGGDPNNPRLEDQGTVSISIQTRDSLPKESPGTA